MAEAAEQPEAIDAMMDGGEDGFQDGIYSMLDSHILGAQPKTRFTAEQLLEREVARRRQADMERRMRIFDAKRRTIGLDVETLDRQAAEAQQRHQQEKARAKKEDQDFQRMCSQVNALEIAKQQARRAEEIHAKEYSLQTLHFATRREYDLNDPHTLRKDMPARVGDDDPRCGPASMQQFGGEDLMKEERTRQQRAMQVNCIEQQKFEKGMLLLQENQGVNDWANEAKEIHAVCNEMDANEKALRRELNKQQQGYNNQKAFECAEQRRQLAEQEQHHNDWELQHHATDPFLNEAAEHYNVNGRVKRDAFKGASREHRELVAQQQLSQADANMQQKEYDRHQVRRFDHQSEQTRKHLVAQEIQSRRDRRERTTQIAQENLAMAKQAIENKKKTTELYTNKFSPEFFEQFGTSCR